MIYWDHNATTPLHPAARESWLRIQETCWQNPSALVQGSAKARATLEQAREQFAAFTGCKADEILFTSGATEACNHWIASLAFQQPQLTGPVLCCAQEHAAVHEAILRFLGDRVIWFSPSVSEPISLLQETLDREDAGAVVMMAANNETGACFPWREVASLCRARGIPYFCDASQWVGKMPISDLHLVDGFAASAHKWGGPKGVGVLRFRRAFPIIRGLVGGGQEQGLRAGTEDIASLVAMTEALTARQGLWSCPDQIKTRTLWRERWIHKLEQVLPGVVIHARNEQCLWNTVSVAMPHTRADQWVLELERLGHLVGTGSACSAASGKASRALTDLGVSEGDKSRTLRISSGGDTTEGHWDALLQALIMADQKILQASSGDSMVITLE